MSLEVRDRQPAFDVDQTRGHGEVDFALVRLGLSLLPVQPPIAVRSLHSGLTGQGPTTASCDNRIHSRSSSSSSSQVE